MKNRKLKQLMLAKSIILFLVILLATFTSIVACTGTETTGIPTGIYSSLRDEMTSLIKDKMDMLNIIGTSVALVDDGDIVWTEGFGYADYENSINALPETVYGVGSVSKLFVATAIMQLAEQGKIDIDKPVKEYIPEFSINTRFPDSDPITIRSLMTHHSGIPGSLGYLSEKDDSISGYKNIVDLLKDEYVAYPPNYIFAYSNCGIDLLGVVIERVSGMDFNDYITQNILQPLEMDYSSFIATEKIKEFFSKSYDSISSEESDDPFLKDNFCLPAGTLRSSVLNMSNFIKMVMNNGTYNDKKILNEKTLEEMLTPQNEDIPLDFNFKIGLNWMLNDPHLDYVDKICYHGGDTIYYHSMLSILPEHKLGVMVLCNSSLGSLFSPYIANEILIAALEIKTGITPPEINKISEVILSQSEMEKYIGNYATLIGLLTITIEDNKLKVTSFGQTQTLIPNEDDLLSVEGIPNFRLFIDNINGEKIIALESGSLISAIGKEYIKEEIPESWINRVGEYKCINASDILGQEDIYIYCVYEDGILLLSNKDSAAMGIVISPINDTEAIKVGLGRGMGETVYIRTIDGEEYIDNLGLLFEKVEPEAK